MLLLLLPCALSCTQQRIDNQPRQLPPSVSTPQSLLHTAMLHYKPEVYKQLLAHTHFPEEGAEAAAQRWRTVAVRWEQGAAVWRGWAA